MQMMGFARRKMEQLSDQILEGTAAVSPYELGNKQACTWCPYRAVCGFDEGLRGYVYQRLRPLTPEECWKAIKEECGDGHDLDR